MTTIFIILTCVLGYGCYTLNKKLNLAQAEIDTYELEALELEAKVKNLEKTISQINARFDTELEAYSITVSNLRNGFDSEKLVQETETTSKPKRKPRK